LIFILGWAVAGPFYGFSESWQLVVNSGTTIVTFILAISIQYTQNRDSRAIHMKLNKLLEHTADLQETLDSIEEELENDDD
jgi:low affinity Fe/Cu permease